jgi:hypothetical protein
MIASIDKKTGELSIQLPEELQGHFTALYRDIMDEFGFDPMNAFTVNRINEFIRKWFGDKGIEIEG